MSGSGTATSAWQSCTEIEMIREARRWYHTVCLRRAGDDSRETTARARRCRGDLDTLVTKPLLNNLGQRVGLHVWNHALRHSSITQAATLGQKAGLGLDKIRAHSRHRSIATLLIYVDEQDRASRIMRVSVSRAPTADACRNR